MKYSFIPIYPYTVSFQLPSLFQEKTLTAVLQRASQDEDPEIKRLQELASSHLDALIEMDRKYQETEFFRTVKEVGCIDICLIGD